MNFLQSLFAKKKEPMHARVQEPEPEPKPVDIDAADVLLELAERRDVDYVLRGLDAHLERIQQLDRESEALRLLNWAEGELRLAHAPQPSQFALLGNIWQRLQTPQTEEPFLRAMDFYGLALTAYRGAQELEGMAIVQSNMGLALIELAKNDPQQYAEAIPLLEEALQYYENGEDWSCRADICLNLGEAYSGLQEPGFDHYELGREFLQRSGALYERSGDMRGQAMAQGRLGDVQVELAGQERQAALTKAVRHYRNALTLFVELQDLPAMARYQERLANAYGRLGEVEHLRNSLRAAQRAVELYEKLEQDDDLARASLGLGRLQLTLVGFGEEEELLPAFEQLRRALGLFRKLNDRQGRAECLMGLTQIYLHGDNERQEADMRQAFDCLAEALAIYRLLGDDEAVAFAQRMMDNFDRAGDRVE